MRRLRMAERQQTFARNHRDVCAGLTGTNITITLILERFGKHSFASNWYHILLMHTHTDVIFSILQLLGMAFSMTLYQQIHRMGKKYDA